MSRSKSAGKLGGTGVGEGDAKQTEEGKRILSRYDFGKRWHRFHVLTPRLFILRGSRAMNDPRFKYRSRGRQAAPCSVVAIVYGRLIKPKEWTKEYVDQVLEYGDKLFRVSVTKNRVKEDEYMKAGLVHNQFYVGFYKVLVFIEDSGIRGNLFSESVGCSDLAEGLRKFLRNNDAAVITVQGHSVAMWRQSPDASLFYYDPAPCDEIGARHPDGTACLMRFKGTDELRDHVMKNIDRRYDSRYCIDKVTVMRVTEIGRGFVDRVPSVAGPAVQKSVLRSINPMDIDEHKTDCTKPVPKERKPRALAAARVHKQPLSIAISNYSIDRRFATEPLVNRNNFDTGYSYDDMRVNVPSTFKELPGKIAILRGLTHEGSEMYKGKGGQNVANCVMSIAVKSVNPVKTWVRTKLDEILTLGDTLCANVKSEKPLIKTMTAADLDDARVQLEDRKLVVDVDIITVTGTVSSKVPSVLNLKQALEEFFLVNEGGVIETTSMAVAIWTQDDSYYLFDPRPCDAAGVRIREEKAVKAAGKGKEADAALKEKREAGSCCVIRFSDVNSLAALFLKNIDPAKKNDRFTIRHVAVVDDIAGARSWNEFQPGVAGETWVLRGKISNADESFEEENQGAQGLAMPIVALVSARETPPTSWSSETVDEAVREGDAYYSWCKPPGAEEEAERTFLLQDLKKNFYFKNRKVKIDVEEAAVVGDLTASDDAELPNLGKGLRQFFDSRQYGVVEARNLPVAVWKVEEEAKDKKKETFYYYFDANPRDKLGRVPVEADEENAACVVRASDISALANLIARNAGQDERGNDFTIHELKNVSIGTPMTDEEVEVDKRVPIRPDLNNYASLGETGALLLGTIDQGNEAAFKRLTRNKQQAANSFTALAMTRLYNPHLWYRELVDDVLKIGDKVTAQNFANLPEVEPDEESPRNYLLPSEITEDFAIGVNKMSVGLEEETVTGKTTELTRLLEQFFENNTMGVFRQGDVMLPIWKEADVFFAMDPRGRNAQAEPMERDGAAAVMWFTDLPSLADAVRPVVRGEDIVIDAVTLENSYETRVAEAERVRKTVSGEDLWHYFPKVADGVWSIDGTVTMTDERFDEENRGKQSAAVAAMAIIFSKVYQPRYWTPSVLDEVIVTGDKLHSKCVEKLGVGSIPLVNEIISEFFLSSRRIGLTIKDCVQAGSLTGRPPKVQDLQSGIDSFFDKYDAGALTSGRDRNIAIWKMNDAYYTLVPDWSTTEEVTSTTPRVFRFRDTSLLVDCLSRYLEQEGDYQITAIDVLDWNKLPPWKFDPSPAIRPANLPPLNAYRRLLGEARAILRGSYHQGHEIFPGVLRNRQTAANCIVALGMSVVKSPVTWTKKTMDEILAIGSGVHLETKKTRPAKSRLKPKDIIRVFYVGVNILTADVEPSSVIGLVAIAPPDPEEDKKKKKGKDEKPKAAKDKKKVVERERPPPPPLPLLEEGLRKFFQDNRAGILVTGRGMIAVWKDLGVYFMYDSRARSDQGLPDAYGTSCVMWFACMEPLYDVIFANIDPREKYGPFEICRVVINTAMIEPLPCPVSFRSYLDRTASSIPINSLKTSTTLEIEPLSEYIIVDEELSVLRGTLHMNHRVFSPKNRGLQGTAIAAVAIVVGLLHVPSTWTPQLIDAVLKYGDLLHSDSARAVRPDSRNLSPSELLTVFVVGDFRATIHVHNHTAAGILHAFDLAEALSMFFRTNCAGILHTTNVAVAVMQHYGKFYMFDPCSRNDQGKPAHGGAACVTRCDSIARMAKIFVANCNFKRPNVYTLNAVNVLSLHFFSDARSVCPPKNE